MLLSVTLAGCGGGSTPGSAGLESGDPAARSEAVKVLCADPAQRPELATRAAALPPAIRLELMHAAARVPGAGECLAAFPVQEQARYWLVHPDAIHAEAALAALGTAAEPSLAEALSGPTPGTLRAARALLARWASLAPAGRATFLAALPALVDAGLEMGSVALLGDAAFAALAKAPGPAARAALEGLWSRIPEPRRGAAVGPLVGMDLRARSRYALGSAQWLMLIERTPAWLPDVGKMWLRTTRVTVLGDGHEVVTRDWPTGRNLAAPAEVQLELGALAGAALTEEGTHELELVFDAQVVAPGVGGRIDTAPVLWSGKLRTAKVSFEVVRIRPAELVTMMASPEADPRASLGFRLHAGGKSVDLVLRPATSPVPTLDVPAGEPRASLKATATAALRSGLAMELVARPPAGPEIVVAQVGLDALEPGPLPRDLATVDLTPFLKAGKPIKLTLELRPSSAVAYKHPGIERYWGEKIALGEVTLNPIPAPKPATP